MATATPAKTITMWDHGSSCAQAPTTAKARPGALFATLVVISVGGPWLHRGSSAPVVVSRASRVGLWAAAGDELA